MKTKHFYTFLVETTDITIELGNINLKKEERVHLLSLVDANIHASVVKIILDNLDNENKKIFLKNLASNNHTRTWDHLKSNLENAEGKIRKSINETLKELKKDILKAKKSG